MTAATTEIVSLEEVLAYRKPAVVRRFAKEQGVSLAEAEGIFQEMLKWLYLCYRSNMDTPEGIDFAMTPELLKIDDMWHTFVIFTRDYADFCEHYFGFFLHHVPNEDESEEVFQNIDVAREQLERQLGLVYDVLGEETLRSWYEEGRYTAAAEATVS